MATKNKMKEVTKDFLTTGRKNSDLSIRKFPWTEKQIDVLETAMEENTKIVFIKAPPGVGKTLMAAYVGLARLKNCNASILYVRAPIESCSKGVGFLPSTIELKMEPYIAPLKDQLSELASPALYAPLIEEGVIKGIPMGFLKGTTCKNMTVILDEAEDLSIEEIRLSLCRLGKSSVMFVIGDEKQSNVKNSGFAQIFDAFDDDESRRNGIFCFEFFSSDCKRSGITKYIIDKFDGLM